MKTLLADEEAINLFWTNVPLQYPVKRGKRSRAVALIWLMLDIFLKRKRVIMILVETSDDPQNNKRYKNSARSMQTYATYKT